MQSTLLFPKRGMNRFFQPASTSKMLQRASNSTAWKYYTITNAEATASSLTRHGLTAVQLHNMESPLENKIHTKHAQL